MAEMTETFKDAPIRIARIARGVFAAMSGRYTWVIERARIVLQRRGSLLHTWLKYLRGTLSSDGSPIWICLGNATRSEIREWLGSQNGADTLYVYRLFEHMLSTIGMRRCLAFATVALRAD